jgi:hypothetical protein
LNERQKNTPYPKILAMLPGRRSTGALAGRLHILQKPKASTQSDEPRVRESESKAKWSQTEDDILLEARRMNRTFDDILPSLPGRKRSNALVERMKLLEASDRTFVDTDGILSNASDVG